MSAKKIAPDGKDRMTHDRSDTPIVAPLDSGTRAIVRLAGAIASLDEAGIRPFMAEAATAPHTWVEEVVLQSYLFAGFPRTLNAMREWRRVCGAAPPDHDEGERMDLTREWRARGEETCAVVYGPFYERLRHNIRGLHPALDSWMIVEGYGKVLSRPGLDLGRRELCIVAACAASRQDRQLHSHLHGARHAGVPDGAIEDALTQIADLLSAEDLARSMHLWGRIRQAASPAPTESLARGRASNVH